MAWREQIVDLTLDGGLNANASEYAVNPPQLLKAKNVICDTPGVPRRAPTGVSEAGVMTVGTAVSSHNVGAAAVYGALARGAEAAVIGKNGLSRVLLDGAGSGAWQHLGDGSYTPAAVPSYELSSARWTTSGNDTHRATSYLEHGGFKLLAYVPEDASGTQQGLRLQVAGSDGLTAPQDLQIAAAADVAMLVNDPIELVGGTATNAWVVWRRASTTIAVCEITLSATGSTAGSVQNAIFSVDATANYAACADKDVTNDDLFVVVHLTSGGNWWVQKLESGSVTGTYDTTVPAPTVAVNRPDIDHVTSNGADVLLMAVPNNTSGNVDVLTMTTVLGTVTLTAGALTPTSGASKACFCCGAYGFYFVAVGARAGLHAAILNASHTVVAQTDEIRGYNVASRPGELDGRPVWPLQWHNDSNPVGDVIVSPQWGTGSTPGNLFLVPCGRYGNDVNATTFGATSQSKVRADTTSSSARVAWSYTAELQGWGQTLRSVVLDASTPETRRSVQDGGLTYASGSVLTAYDGRVHREADWITPPTVGTVTSGGNGTAVGTTGNWSVRAVHVWIDASARAHRSSPSAAVIGSLNTADSLDIEISLPYCTSSVSNLHGWPPDEDTTAFFTEIYLMNVGGGETNHHLATHSSGTSMQPTSVAVAGGLNEGTFDDVSHNTAGAVIYDEVGGELWQNPSPPVADLEIIGNRMWLLEAEDRERLWPSKERVDGYAWEWNAGMVRRVPGGEVVALSQINGSPLALRRDGVLVVYGDGPGNNGTGGIFTPPRKIDSAPGCITGTTVVKVPMGVVYQSDRGFFLLTPQHQATQIGLEVEALVDNNFVAATYSERDGRVVFWRDTSGTDDNLVWDVRSNKWSTWDPGEATIAAVQLEGGDVATFATSGTDIVEARYGTSYTAGNGMVLETAWLKPGNVNGRADWAEVFLTAEKLDDHSVTIDVFRDYDGVTTDEPQTWTAAELDGEIAGAGGTVYTISKRIESPKARAIKIRVTESAISGSGEAVRPISLRVIYKTDGKTERAQAATTGRK